ncbi:hypothetical protein B0T25DRAFT_560908 [Lasiosphaeria hispida]|uniref:Secreted protein n=1 Tax=Lasiosphaeria hispida TaxID=260671 RepID=A0AAJ0H5W3_9PEZI|nr:hypothetical protein B0T25DRAFT_560908 [Lasiosphaeria hispida]
MRMYHRGFWGHASFLSLMVECLCLFVVCSRAFDNRSVFISTGQCKLIRACVFIPRFVPCDTPPSRNPQGSGSTTSLPLIGPA